MTQKNVNPWTFDTRVRERNLKSGSLTEKELEKYLQGLPDIADQSEAFGTSQPALEQPIAASEPELDDEIDDEEEDEEEETEAPAAQEQPLNGTPSTDQEGVP